MEIEELRKRIDELDSEITSLLSRRISLIREIARIKKRDNIPVRDDARESEVIEKLKKAAKKKNLDENFVAALYRLILENSKKEQENEIL